MTDTLFISFIFLLFLFYGVRGMRERSIRNQLLQSGIKTYASVNDLRALWYLRHFPRIIVYSYSVGETKYTRQNDLNRKQFRRLKALQSVEILYLKENPGISRVVEILKED